MKDPYDLLGVRRGDSDETIRKAYHKLAKRHHPDLNPGKPEAAERFKEINAANDLLSDTTKRARFDRGEIDGDGNEGAPRPSARRADTRRRAQSEAEAGGRAEAFHWSQAGGGAHGRAGGTEFEDLEGLFADAFDGSGRRAGGDVHYALTVDFMDAAIGAVKRLSLPDGRTLDVTIPAGLRDGHVLRLRGQGRPGQPGGQPGRGTPPGDALVEVTVAAHPYFRREGDDIIVRLPVTLQEAVLGATVPVPTIKGTVRLAIPANSVNGARLRLKGRGIGAGHQFVELAVMLPSEPEPALAEFLRSWKPAHPIDPRADLEA